MITRIPQPQLWGPSPAEVQSQQNTNMTRLSEMFQTAVQEAAKNYTAQQQVKVEQERNKTLQQEANTGRMNAQTESDRLKYGLMSKDLYDDLQKSGPMSYVTRKPEWLDYFTWEAGGDKNKAKAYYEGGASALNHITGVDALRSNLIQVASQGAPQGTQVPAVPPVPAAPSGQVQGAAVPSAVPQASTQMLHPLPENAAEMTPDLVGQMAGNKALMDAFRKSLTDSGIKGVAASGNINSNSALLQGNKDSFLKFVKSMNADMIGSLVGTRGAASQQSQSMSITETFKGIPPEVQKALSDATSKIEAAMNGDLTIDVTGKDIAAVKRSASFITVDEGRAQLKAYLEGGGTREALDAAVKQLNDIAASDPDFLDRVNHMTSMSDADWTKWSTATAADLKAQDVETRKRLADEKWSKASADISLGVAKLQASIWGTYSRVKAEAARTNSDAARLDASKKGQALAALGQLETASSNYRTDFINAYTKDKGTAPGVAQIQKHMLETLKDDTSQLYLANVAAARYVSEAFGVPIAEATGKISAATVLGLFTLPGQEGSTTTYPSAAPTLKNPSSGSSPRNPPSTTPPGALTPAQKQRVMNGQAPGNP
jgi:hypothetical protein